MGRIFAHRVNAVDFEIQPTFDCQDVELNLLLEDEFSYFYTPAGYRLSLEDIDRLILLLKDDPMQAASFKRDKLWAELHNTNWVHYHVIGDNYDGEFDDDHLSEES